MTDKKIEKAKNIREFFDPYSVDHLKAYEVLCKTGVWPVGFVPDDIEFPAGWPYMITARMAGVWVEQAKAGNVNGIPSWE